MSKISFKPADTGTATFTIEAPATNTNRTLTLPDEAGTILNDASTIDSNNLQSDVYKQSNILGTVSESSGVPTGAIIERGSNANGQYVRYADGTMICFVLAETKAIAPIATAFTLGFRSSAKAQTLPSSFINTDYKIATNNASNSGVFVRTVADSTSTLGVAKFWPTSVTDGATARSADAIIVGRWY